MQPTPRTHHTIGELDCTYARFDSSKPDQTTVLALHGWGVSADLVAPVGQRLAQKNFTVIAPDLPGFGDSKPPTTAWSVYDYANHVVRLMDALQLEKVHLFGHSFGGRLSLIIGAQHADRIVSIALANSAGVLPRKDTILEARTTLYKTVRDGLKNVGLNALSDNLRDWYIGRYASSDYKNAGVLRESFVKIVNEDLLPYAAKIAAPTLLIWGAKDEDTPLWQGQKLASTIPNAGIVVYDDAGHYSYLDHLTEVTATLDYFYKHPTGSES